MTPHPTNTNNPVNFPDTTHNNRIQELAAQCKIETHGVNGELLYEGFNEEKFAELILRDIDDILDDLYHASALEHAVILMVLNENIKEHFYGDK
jgi:hypothetical protein